MRHPLVSALSGFFLLALAACAPEKLQSTERVTTTPPGSAFSAPAPSLTGTDSFASQQASALPPPAPVPPSTLETAASRIPANVPQVKVALLVPLSGESQALGQAMLDAASLALYDQYIALKSSEISARVVLVPKDTGSGPSTAVVAANQAVEQGVSLIIGPVFSSSVSSIAPIAAKANIPVLSLSNNKTVAGPNVYVYGFLPEQQVARAADFAAMRNVAAMGALVPNDAYGNTVSATLKNILNSKGVRVEPVEVYARSPVNLDAAVIRLKEGYDKTPFTALFLAEGGDQLKLILKTLKNRQLDKNTFRLIGTGLWDEDEIKRNPEMVGSWFASSPPALYEQFEKRFELVYGYKPKRLAGLAYDAVALASSLALVGGGPNYAPFTMTRKEGFIGPANGLYRIRNDGTTERALSVMEIEAGGYKVLDAAPRVFDK